MKHAILMTAVVMAIVALIVYHGQMVGWKEAAIIWGGAALGSLALIVIFMVFGGV